MWVWPRENPHRLRQRAGYDLRLRVVNAPVGTMSYVLGIDPGAREVGVVLRKGNTVLRTRLLNVGRPVGALELRLVCDEIESIIPYPFGPLLIAVESVNAPSPHMNRRPAAASAVINVGALLTTAAMWGALMVWEWPPDCTVMSVPPAGHGSKLLAAYPPELVSKEERNRGGINRVGGGRYRHLRSAWDIAGAAALMARAGAA
jgi:hypothetical protein